jgi:hypothetical protein
MLLIEYGVKHANLKAESISIGAALFLFVAVQPSKPMLRRFLACHTRFKLA